ncbi:MAG TPA: FlgD immunoglobulin-like domain containing protein, partial [bacterium]|nr:FlgD immunoglobulin-like domain containing protein [bacterium]
ERYCRVDRIALTNDPRPNFYSPEPNQWLNLTKPAELVGPVAIVRNTPFEITWESLNMGPLVNLEYSLDYGRTFILIDEDVQNTGSFVWSVPDTVTEEGVIRISAPLGYCPMDINWMPFYIVNPPPVVTVTAPNGGETLAAKDTTQITWSSARFDQPVSLYLSLDGGATWSEIAAGQSNTGSWTWIVPKTLSDSCLIKVKAADAEIPVDLSDALFHIVRPAGEEPSLTLTAPNGGESFEAGRVETIEWISEYLTGHVALLFSADSGRTWSEFATGLPAAGAYEWTIPATASEQCLIKVADSATGAIVDLSDAPFSISALPQNFALAFDGEDDLLQVAHHPSLNISGTMTIAFWMQNHQLGQSWSRILEKGTFDEYAISFYSNTGRLAGTLRSTIPGGARMQTLFGPSFSIIPVREWVHVAVTYDGTTASLYINGILETSKTGKAAPRTLIRDLIIGAALHNDVYEYHFKGLLDEMSFWSVALTPEQIADRMFERPRGSEESLVAYYSFDEGSGQFAHDKGPNLLHGRLGKTADTDESDPLWISIDRPARMAALAVLEKSFAPLEEVIEQEEIPLTCELGQNYPNPFNASTTITYTVPEMPESGSLRLDIFDIQGRLIRTLAQGTAAAGSHQILWNGTNEQGEMVPSGIYFYRLQAGSFQEIKRMVMLK